MATYEPIQLSGSYGELLAALELDLQLNALTDLQRGTVQQALLADAGRASTAGAALGYLVLKDAKGNTYKIPYHAS